MVSERAATADPYFIERLASADVVVLCDGSPLHARSVCARTPSATPSTRRRCSCDRRVASVLGDVMIDPRGGAPTTGLGYRIVPPYAYLRVRIRCCYPLAVG